MIHDDGNTSGGGGSLRRYASYSAILLFACLPYILFVVLLGNHEFWDAVFIENYDHSTQWSERFTRAYQDSNWYMPFYLISGMLQVETLVDGTYRGIYVIGVVGFISLIFVATYHVARRFEFSGIDGLLIAGLGISFPALHVLACAVHLIFLSALSAFVCAAAVLVCARRPGVASIALIWLLMAFALQMQSLAFFSLAVGVYGLWCAFAHTGSARLRFALASVPFLVVPFLWRGFYLLFPPQGMYSGYNTIDWQAVSVIPKFALYTVYHYAVPFSLLFATIVAALYSVRRQINWRHLTFAVAVCGLAFLLALTPYFVVNKHAAGPWNDWGDRNAIILVVAMPIMWASLWRVFENVKWFRLAAGTALVTQGLLLSTLYLGWYYRSLEDVQLVHLINELPEVQALQPDTGAAVILTARKNTFNRHYRDYELSEYMKLFTGRHIYVATVAEALSRRESQLYLYPRFGELVHNSIGGFDVNAIFESRSCVSVAVSIDERMDLRPLFSNIIFVARKLLDSQWRQHRVANVTAECVPDSASRNPWPRRS